MNDDLAPTPDLSFDGSESPVHPAFADAERLHARVLAARRTHRQSYHQLATLLCEVADSAAYAVLGYTGVIDYAVTALDLTRRATRDLLAVGRRLRELPVLNAATAAGEVDWSKVREVVRVADPETEVPWTEFAKTATTREVEQRVARAVRGDTPEDAFDREENPRGLLERCVFELERTDRDTLYRALALIRSQCGGMDAISDGVVLATLARRVLEDATLHENAPSAEPYRVVVRVCPKCDEMTTVDGDPVSDTIASEACCDGEVVDMTPGPHVGHATRAIPPALRRCVLDRDNWRCAIPGCRNQLWVDVHHLLHWANGGRHVLENLVTLCTCHHRLVHEGLLAVDRGKDGRIEVRRGATGHRSDPLAHPAAEASPGRRCSSRSTPRSRADAARRPNAADADDAAARRRDFIRSGEQAGVGVLRGLVGDHGGADGGVE